MPRGSGSNTHGMRLQNTQYDTEWVRERGGGGPGSNTHGMRLQNTQGARGAMRVR